MKSFPKPLTAEEEAYYLRRYREGDMDAKRVLIVFQWNFLRKDKGCSNYVYEIAKSLKKQGYSIDFFSSYVSKLSDFSDIEFLNSKENILDNFYYCNWHEKPSKKILLNYKNVNIVSKFTYNTHIIYRFFNIPFYCRKNNRSY